MRLLIQLVLGYEGIHQEMRKKNPLSWILIILFPEGTFMMLKK